MKWVVVSLADGDTHLAVPADKGAMLAALCGQLVRQWVVLDQDPHRPPPDPDQACPECVAAYRRRSISQAPKHQP